MIKQTKTLVLNIDKIYNKTTKPKGLIKIGISTYRILTAFKRFM